MTRETGPTLIWHNQPIASLTGDAGIVYLLHFPNDLKGRSHYIGWANTENLEQRMLQHASGTGARFTAAITLLNPIFFVAQLWPDKDRYFEKVLKRRGNYKRHCFCTSEQTNHSPLATVTVDLALRSRSKAASERMNAFLDRLNYGKN